ncbi:hypothetical protein ACIRP3_01760 [Streptomyces sp. NPDC101209]|uniref:hypothetical protein n=1 Tax=Streptomyces sp. NPDC101209 TaxID=3366129 RepID=UPI0038238CA5
MVQDAGVRAIHRSLDGGPKLLQFRPIYLGGDRQVMQEHFYADFIDVPDVSGEFIARHDIATFGPALRCAYSSGNSALTTELDIAHGAGLSWAPMVRAVFDEMRPGGLSPRPMVARPLQQTLLTGLLLATDHRYRDELDRPDTTLRPGPVKRADEAVHASRNTPSWWRNWPRWLA